jgi:hypothetical protein
VFSNLRCSPLFPRPCYILLTILIIT